MRDDFDRESNCDADEAPSAAPLIVDAYGVTWFRWREDARGGVRITLARDELAAQLAAPASWYTSKDDLPLLSTATFARNHRNNENVESVSMLGLDLDERQADAAAYVARVAEALGGVETFAYSTFSSEPGAFKLRGFIPYDRPATADEHSSSWALATRRLARHGVRVDGKCKDPCRGFYVWAVPPSGCYWHAHIEGAAWPAGLAAEAERRIVQKRASRTPPPPPPGPASNGYARARAYVDRMPVAVSGAGGHDATFAVARKLVHGFRLSDAECWTILLEYNQRCAPPWSERELRHKLKQARERAKITTPVADRSRRAS